MQQSEQDTSDAALSPVRERKPAQSGTPLTRLSAGALLLLALVMAGVFGSGLFAGWQFASDRLMHASSSAAASADSAHNAADDALREAGIARVRPAVVEIRAVTEQGIAVGSGVIIDTRGYIVTDYHVMQRASTLYAVLFDGTVLPLRISGTDPPDDLAVLQVISPAGQLPIALLGDSAKLEPGQAVLALGSPAGISQNVTSGIISALNLSVSTIPDAIQTDAALNPGNNGGALVDLQGNLVGLLVGLQGGPRATNPAGGMSFAIPSNRVALIASQLIEAGKITSSGRASLAVQLADVDAVLAARDGLASESGVFIVAVEPGGPADRAGLNPGDVIQEINAIPTPDISSLDDALLSRKPGETVVLLIQRRSQRLTVKVELTELRI